MRLAALAVLVPLVRAACPDPIDTDNPECAGCENQDAAKELCRAFVESVHTQNRTAVPLCSILTKTILPVGNVAGVLKTPIFYMEPSSGHAWICSTPV